MGSHVSEELQSSLWIGHLRSVSFFGWMTPLHIPNQFLHPKVSWCIYSMFSRFKSIVYRKDSKNLFFKRLLSKCVFEKIRLPLSLQLSKYDCRCKSKEFFLHLQPLQPVQIGHLQRWSKWTYMEDETIMPLSKFQKTLRVSFALATDAEITLVR